MTIPKPFAVGKYEVTFDEWDICVQDGGCKRSPNSYGWGRGRRPVIDVSWDDMKKEYLPWLNRRTGKTYRLLTEAEWEYAARAGGRGKWSFGDAEAELGQHAWYDANAGSKTQPVGGKKANAFGLHDLHGNVWEWVEDCWNDSYAAKPANLKASGAGWTTGDCVRRVLRGGSWGISWRWDLRAASRIGITTDFRSYYVGFRVGSTLTP